MFFLTKVELKKQLRGKCEGKIPGADDILLSLIQTSKELSDILNKEDDLYMKLKDGIENILALDIAISPYAQATLEKILKSNQITITQIVKLTPLLKALQDDIS